jgi:hypothetical protein
VIVLFLGKIDPQNTAIRFYYLRQETSNIKNMNIESEEDVPQYFHFDIPITDNSPTEKESNLRAISVPLATNIPAIPSTSLLPSFKAPSHNKIQLFSTVGTVTKISGILKPSGNSWNDLLHNSCQLQLKTISVGPSTDSSSQYYLNPIIKWSDEDSFVLRFSIVGNHSWISVGIRFIENNPEGIMVDFLLIPLSAGELIIPSIKVSLVFLF